MISRFGFSLIARWSGDELPDIFFIHNFVSIWQLSTTMNRLRAIPPRASIVEFSLHKTSRGEVQRQQDMVRTPSESRQRSTSPRKRQRLEDDGMEPNFQEDAFVYLEYQANVCKCTIYIYLKTMHGPINSKYNCSGGQWLGSSIIIFTVDQDSCRY